MVGLASTVSDVTKNVQL